MVNTNWQIQRWIPRLKLKHVNFIGMFFQLLLIEKAVFEIMMFHQMNTENTYHISFDQFLSMLILDLMEMSR